MQQKRTLSEVATSFILLGCFGAAWFYVAGPVGLMVAITVLIAFRLQIALFDESNRLNIAALAELYAGVLEANGKELKEPSEEEVNDNA